MFEQMVINVISALIATAIIAFTGYIFRNKIRKILKGVDLLALDETPDIEFVDLQYITDLNSNKMAHFLISNCGHINIAKIRLFKCSMKNAGNPTTLTITKLPYERQFTSIRHDSGEAMQIGIDTHFFKIKESYPDIRLFVELNSEDGSYFRATIVRTGGVYPIEFDEGGFSVIHIGRVKRPLPFWNIKSSDPPHIEQIRRKYDLDLTVG